MNGPVGMALDAGRVWFGEPAPDGPARECCFRPYGLAVGGTSTTVKM